MGGWVDGWMGGWVGFEFACGMGGWVDEWVGRWVLSSCGQGGGQVGSI
jgi:hypothetical protein